MGEEQQVAYVVIKQKSVFKVKDFYSFIYDLITSQGFDVFEKEFNQDGQLTTFEWDCFNYVDDYVKFRIWIKCYITGAKSVKVKRQGVTESMEKADVKVRIKGKISTDWKDRWEANPLIKFLKGFYDKYLFNSTFDERKKRLVEKVYLIENEIKSFFELPRFM